MNVAELDVAAVAQIDVKIKVVGQISRTRGRNSCEFHRRNLLVCDDVNRLEHEDETLLEQVKLALVLLE